MATALFTLGTERRPRLPAVVLVLLVGVLLVLPAMPVQAAIWVLPFAALAVPRWRDLLVVGVGRGGVRHRAPGSTSTGSRFPSAGCPPWLYAVLVAARGSARSAGSCTGPSQLARAARSVDPVREHGLETDDPAAGELEDAPDALVVSFA